MTKWWHFSTFLEAKHINTQKHERWCVLAGHGGLSQSRCFAVGEQVRHLMNHLVQNRVSSFEEGQKAKTVRNMSQLWELEIPNRPFSKNRQWTFQFGHLELLVAADSFCPWPFFFWTVESLFIRNSFYVGKIPAEKLVLSCMIIFDPKGRPIGSGSMIVTLNP